ncbi:hypothetical protein [Streptomyces pinistramenti]|uniref:hypothetical protein n=1 Tax=Streptomyces pinistramenti TaxID=2884812 RepID=UPI0022229D05|nr:hypothetical protein [Streptomyces pinistramenti]
MVQYEAGRCGVVTRGAAAVPGASAAHRAAKRPGAVKREATAILWWARAVSARTVPATVGRAADA